MAKPNVTYWEADDFDNELHNFDNIPEECEDRIAQCLNGRSIFVTGGTGFLGKVLIEKLLRSCPDVKKIYILIRSKKGKDPQLRIKELFENPLFDTVKATRGEDVIFQSLYAIAGDIMQPGLGISQEDRKLLADEVSLIYHCAASVRFDEPLRKAVLLNARGTKLVLEIAKECKKLDLFVYVSTAYSHLLEKELYEKPYPAPADPDKVIQTCEWLSAEDIDAITPQILGNIPNSYAYTKALAENLVVQTFDEMPSTIVRPSIVIPIWKEPIPGWTDNINGPTGLLIGAGKGVIRTMWCNSSAYGDFLPVDVAINGILISTWYNIKDKKINNRVTHMTSSNEIKISWAEIIELGRWVIENRLPLNGVAWYPGGSMKSNYYVHYLCFLLFHMVPAIFVDCLLFCLGYPPVLCRVQRRISRGFEVFQYYANNEWHFDNTEAVKIRKSMNKLERKKYFVERLDLDLVEYFETCVLCARRYILKESDDTIPAARRHMKIMWFLDRFVKLCFISYLVYFVYSRFLAGFLGEYESLIPIAKSLDTSI